MAGKKTAVFGIYSTAAAAEHAVDTLTKSGFPISDISLLVPETLGSREMGTEKASKAPEGAAVGATGGAVLGGTLGLLAGIGALAIPGVGPFIAAGPIMATLAGLGVGGAVGGLTGSLIGAGIPEFEAKRYEGRLQKGGILLSVHCDTSAEIDQAKEILERTRAEDVSSTRESSADTKRDARSASGGR
jgi:ActD protein